MATFCDLPNELLLGIWVFIIDPKDVESFALVSKKTYSPSMSFLKEHAHLKRNFSRISVSLESGPSPAHLLQQISEHPRIGLYIYDLDMGRCVFNLDLLSGLLPSVKNLKSFHCVRNIGSDPNIIPVHHELLACCKHSLQTLYLQNERKMKGDLGGLTRFLALKEVNADLVSLFGTDEVPRQSLADVLPMSIEKVTLFSHEMLDWKVTRGLVLGMVGSKMNRLPNLQKLNFEAKHTWAVDDTAENEGFKNMCDEVGVELNVSDSLHQSNCRHADLTI